MSSVILASLAVAIVGIALAVAEGPGGGPGDYAIELNRGARRLRVRGGRSLLASLAREGILVPSACGGRGACGYCKVQVTEGGGPLTPSELALLTEAERAAGVRLSCQVRVRSRLAVEVPQHLFSVQQFVGVVERLRALTPDIKELRIRLLRPEAIAFVPGQYVQLAVPAYGSHSRPVYRAYSISSPPSDKGHVELIIRLVPGGICTTWVFTLLKEGDTVRLNGPYGEFRLAEGDREMVWIAGGSGMAPFWSMARHMREHGIQRRCTCFFGAVKERDLFFLGEFRELERAMPNLRFVPALSGAEGDGWAGEKGLITDVVARHIGDGSDKEGYLCGSSGMIDAAAKVLKAKGIPENRIFYDKFT